MRGEWSAGKDTVRVSRDAEMADRWTADRWRTTGGTEMAEMGTGGLSRCTRDGRTVNKTRAKVPSTAVSEHTDQDHLQHSGHTAQTATIYSSWDIRRGEAIPGRARPGRAPATTEISRQRALISRQPVLRYRGSQH